MPKSYRLSKRGKGLAHDQRWKKFKTEQKRKERKAVLRGEKQPKRNKLSKDPGIPNLYPFKKEMLKKLLEDKTVTADSLQRVMAANYARELQSQLDTNQLVQQHTTTVVDNLNEADKFEQEHHMRRQAFKSDLMNTIDQADVIIEVIDARDPENTRNPEAEQYCLSKKKPFVLLLNKIDLVPGPVIQQWLAFYKSVNIPTICFKCPQNIQKGTVRYANAQTGMHDKSACIGSFELKHLINRLNDSKKIIAACVGYPNTGKSSVINALANRPACQSAPIPGLTRTVQEIHIDQRIRILDTPGVIYDTKKSVILREELLVDPIGEIARIFGMMKAWKSIFDHYELEYQDGMDLESVVRDFTNKLGKRLGRVKQGGLVDLEQIAREVIRDWNRGSLKFWRTPESIEHVNQVINGEWTGFDANMLDKFNFDVLGHLATLNGVELK
ncbi:Nucleolar_GTPase [Hexamita inflata]|uniref:Nucleolar GTPase n=1 Tax=Hexamita inflata TaxID=28002 RepID=A0AA86P896_9EUKA|nr:Nucleolar GTPase [Hexamita inflata]CAI9948523.1 Nucleolar GTPase [Hexamita inflata]CAI9974063.1 Nucleolar GTPase [Hexamita inflata]